MSNSGPKVPNSKVLRSRPRRKTRAPAQAPSRNMPWSGRTRWVDNQVMNLGALSACLASDLAPYLPASQDVCGDWSPITPLASAVKQLSESLLKKYEWESSEAADKAALEKFLQVNKTCGEWVLDKTDWSDTDHVLWGELRSALYMAFYPSSTASPLSVFEDLLEHGKVGPGGSLGATGTGLYSKLFSSELTCTSEGLYRLYRSYVDTFPMWAEAEQVRAAHFGEYRIVPGNKMSFVPKNVDISRVICVEPSLNMFVQLGVKHALESVIRKTFAVDFKTQQEKNRDLAQLGSMFKDHWVTIDLSSASDSLACSMMREVLPPAVMAVLEFLRSPSMLLPDGSELKLNMISTMGNGFTFPLQTLLFLCVVKAAHRVASVPLERPHGQSRGNFGVYGDDIICQTSVSAHVLRLLQILGFTVNQSKTFVEGPFRESCGGDFFEGHNVRGVYIDSLRCTQDACVAINLLNRWTARTGVFLPRTVRCLVKMVHEVSKTGRKTDKLLRVPLHENDDAGIKVPRSLVYDRLLCPDTQSVLYERFESRSRNLVFKEDGRIIYPSDSQEGESPVPTRKRKARRHISNPDGLVLAFLNGNLSGGCEGVRHDIPSYQTKTLVTPNWDYLGLASSIALEDSSMRLGTAISGNTGWS